MLEDKYQKCIETCLSCVSICNECAVSCLEEKEIQSLTKCIRLNLECAVICQVTAELISLNSQYIEDISGLCATACNACAEECEQHANSGMEYCKECAAICRTCAAETKEITQNLKDQPKEIKSGTILQEECAAISRATAVLMSLKSGYAEQIAGLNTVICHAATEELEKSLNMEITLSKRRASLSDQAHQDVTGQEQEMTKEKTDISKANEQSIYQKGLVNQNKKHSSALLAASLWRRPVTHSRPRSLEKIQNPFWVTY